METGREDKDVGNGWNDCVVCQMGGSGGCGGCRDWGADPIWGARLKGWLSTHLAASPVLPGTYMTPCLKVEALACSLVERGFGAGDVIAVLLPNCIQVSPSFS